MLMVLTIFGIESVWRHFYGAIHSKWGRVQYSRTTDSRAESRLSETTIFWPRVDGAARYARKLVNWYARRLISIPGILETGSLRFAPARVSYYLHHHLLSLYYRSRMQYLLNKRLEYFFGFVTWFVFACDSDCSSQCS